MMLGRTPWVDRNWKREWDSLRSRVPEDQLPLVMTELDARDSTGRSWALDEYGCGYYGCVSPTGVPGLVVKTTTDESEAWFAYVAMELAQREGGWPSGIVKYHRVIKLEAMHRRRPIYLLWRDEAYEVGYLRKYTIFSGKSGPENTLARNLGEWDRWSSLIRHRLTHSQDPLQLVEAAQSYEERAWHYVAERFDTQGDAIGLSADARPSREGGAWDIARSVRALGVVTEWMQNTYGSQELGSVLDYYLERGLVFCDLHTGNVGKVYAEDYEDLIPGIVDPGQTMPVQPQWYDVKIPDSLSVAA